MQLDPDNETEYRRGGKIMKKTPRKFSAGGTPAPSEKPLSGMELEVQNAKRDAQAKKEKEAYEAQRPTSLGPRPSEKPVVKKAKGGKIKKYELGGDVERDTRFDDDTYSRAYNYVNQLRLPPGAAAEKDYEGGTKSAPKAAPKAAPRKFSAPKVSVASSARSSEAPAPTPRPSGNSLSQGLGTKFTAMDRALRGAEAGTPGYERLKKARDEAKAAYDKASESDRTGKSVVKLARGGGVESKGKTAGKIVKMAKGGSVKGWGMARGSKKAKMV
jgi:hypothetical protein